MRSGMKAWAAAALCCPLGAGFATAKSNPKLEAGIYAVSAYVVSATTSNGGSCTAQTGAYYPSSYTYPGPSKPGAVSRDSFTGPGFNLVSKVVYPTTPPDGATTWSGSYTGTLLPGGTPVAGTFSAMFTVVDSSSYVSTVTFVYPVSQSSNCTEIVQSVSVRSGK